MHLLDLMAWVDTTPAPMRLTSVWSVKGLVHEGNARIVRFANPRFGERNDAHCCWTHSTDILRVRFDANALLRSRFVRGVAGMLYIGIESPRYPARPESERGFRILNVGSDNAAGDWLPPWDGGRYFTSHDKLAENWNTTFPPLHTPGNAK